VPSDARDARVLITLGGLRTDAALMDALPRLGLIACYGTGYEGVDRSAARARGILVTHAGDTNSTAVAEFAMGLVFASARGMTRGERHLRAGRWRGDIIERLSLMPGLAGQRLGIYGLGSIGAKIAQRAAAFEMDIGYHTRTAVAGCLHRYFASLLELAAWADFLVAAAPGGTGTRHLVNADVLAALGPQGYLVNVGRGTVVDTQALIDALRSKRVAGAGLDVLEGEVEFLEGEATYFANHAGNQLIRSLGQRMALRPCRRVFSALLHPEESVGIQSQRTTTKITKRVQRVADH